MTSTQSPIPRDPLLLPRPAVGTGRSAGPVAAGPPKPAGAEPPPVGRRPGPDERLRPEPGGGR